MGYRRPLLTMVRGVVCGLVVLCGHPAEGAETYVVDRLTDANPDSAGEGIGSVGDLRYAVTHAQAGDTIAFGVTGTITLTGLLPSFTQDIRIEGPGANSLTVRGGRFWVASGATVVLSGLTIAGGLGNGGGLFNAGTVTLDGIVVSGNAAGDPTNGGGTGAGIWNYVNAVMTLNSSTVSGNSAVGNASYNPSRGGGIANYGTLTLNHSTVSGNSANYGFGGGINNSGTLTLNDSTVSDNTAAGGSGGIANSGTLTIRNSIIAGNYNTDVSGDFTSLGHNLLGSTAGNGFDTTDWLNVVDPLLAPLEDNGGPTPTMAPLPGSLAIDYVPGTAGVNFASVDQRGVTRPQGVFADIGAVEVVPGAPTFNTVATVAPVTGTFGQRVTLNATLARQDDFSPLAGKVLAFVVGATSAGSATTDPSGTATVSFLINEQQAVGWTTISATYAGGAVYNVSSGSSQLTVSQGAATLSAPDATTIGAGASMVTLGATLRRSSDSANLRKKAVEFLVDGVSVGTAITDSRGRATRRYTVPAAISPGIHLITAVFAGDVLYSGSSHTSRLNRAPVVTNPGPQTAYQGVGLEWWGSASDADGDPLMWSAANLPPGITIDASSGILSGTPSEAGTFNLVVSASDGHAFGQASFSWTVSPVLAAPSPASPIGPVGSVSTNAPAFSWSAVASAASYMLWIDHGGSTSPIEAWYTPAQAGCGTGSGTCTVVAPAFLASGLVTWRLITWNQAGYGPWSSTTSVVVDLEDPSLSAPAPVGPSGFIGTQTPSYSWHAVAGGIWYQVSVTDAAARTIEFWDKAADACAGPLCGTTPNALLAMGPAEWRVRAWSATGSGAWSAPVPFEPADSVPGKATLLAPTTSVTTDTPSFSWSALPGASYYLLRIIDRDNASIDRWYQPSEAQCESGSGTCVLSPGLPIKPGLARWAILGWNGSGYGPWSDGGEFLVEIPDPSTPAPASLSPIGTITSANATYAWTSVMSAVAYRLSISNTGGLAMHWWVSPADAGCDTDIECAVMPLADLQNGTAEWQVQAWTANGYGDWSPAVPLIVSVPAPSVPVPIAPDGLASATTSFTWTASANATSYYVRASDSTGLRVDRWVKPEEVGCPAGAGTCTLNTGLLLSGARAWQVLAWNAIGSSPWSPTLEFTSLSCSQPSEARLVDHEILVHEHPA